MTTVVNKLGGIHAQFWYFDMEVIAGKEDYVVSTVSAFHSLLLCLYGPPAA